MRITKSLIICFLTMLLILTGCLGVTGNNVSTTADAPKATDAESRIAPSLAGPVSISAYAYPGDKTEENATMDAKIKRFMSKHPNVTITPIFWKYENTEIAIKMASNSAQTEFTTWATEGKFLSGKKWIADLSGYFALWPYTKDLNEFALKPYVLDGKTYGVPIDAYAMTITINKKLFAARGVALPPIDWTWDEFLAAAKAVTDQAKGIAGFIPMGKGTEAGWNWTNFLYAAGGDVQIVAEGKVTAAFNSDAGLKALQFYKKLKDADVIPHTWALGYDDALTMFNQGRGAMVMCGGGNALDGAINQGGFSKDDVLLYPIPSLNKGGKHIGVSGGNYKVINGLASHEQQKAAFDFVTDEYFTNAYLDSIDAQITTQKTKHQVYVPQLINYWTDSSDYGQKFQAMLARHDNVFNYSLELKGLLESKVEATYEAQAYYLEMSNAIQQVFTSKGDLDLKGILDDTAAKIQKGSFNKIKIE